MPAYAPPPVKTYQAILKNAREVPSSCLSQCTLGLAIEKGPIAELNAVTQTPRTERKCPKAALHLGHLGYYRDLRSPHQSVTELS